MPSIYELEQELLSLVRGVPAFVNNGYSAYSVDDFEDQTKGIITPCVGVMWEGSAPQGNEAHSSSSNLRSASIVNTQFSIVVAIQYRYNGQDSSKQVAFDLLDDIRKKVIGYRGVNKRPWRFVGEGPEPEESGDGIIFYTQVWQTALPSSGPTA